MLSQPPRRPPLPLPSSSLPLLLGGRRSQLCLKGLKQQEKREGTGLGGWSFLQDLGGDL